MFSEGSEAVATVFDKHGFDRNSHHRQLSICIQLVRKTQQFLQIVDQEIRNLFYHDFKNAFIVDQYYSYNILLLD